MSFHKTPATPRPDIQKNRLAWNESWEKDLAACHSNGAKLLYATLNSQGPLEKHIDEGLNIVQVTKAICDLQHDFARRMVESLATDNFEAKWRNLPDARRQELVLEGICRASVIGEGRRIWCPEITVSGLAGQQGAGFMALVHNLLPADVHSPSVEPTYVSHPVMDVVLQDAGTDPRKSASVRAVRLERIYFLSMVAWQITLTFVSFAVRVSFHAFNPKLICSMVWKNRLTLLNQWMAASDT